MEAQAHDSAVQEKNGEILRLLNQIATDMIRKDDVDRLIDEAVAKATAALKAEYEKRMDAMSAEYEAKQKKALDAMAAEYEAKIAELKKKDKQSGKDDFENHGKSTKNNIRKGRKVICNTKEEAMKLLQEEMNKAAIMQDCAFGKGREKLSSEQKAAIDPIEGTSCSAEAIMRQ